MGNDGDDRLPSSGDSMPLHIGSLQARIGHIRPLPVDSVGSIFLPKGLIDGQAAAGVIAIEIPALNRAWSGKPAMMMDQMEVHPVNKKYEKI